MPATLNEAKEDVKGGASVFRNIAFMLAGLFGLVLVIRLVFLRSYSFDELLHAHLTWLVSVGEKPYQDFAVNHFPFLWIAVAPLLRIFPESPAVMLSLRGLALVFNAIFIGSLAALVCRELQPRQRVWALACFGLVVFSPAVTPYLIEYRPDPLGNALLFGGLLLFRLRSPSLRALFGGAFCIGGAILVNTKCIFFPFVLGGLAVAFWGGRWRQLWRQGLAVGAGLVFAALCAAALLAILGISLDGARRMVLSYNAAVERLHTQGFGLAVAISQHPIGIAWCLAGLVGSAVLFLKQRRWPEMLFIAILAYLVVELILNTRPWKQYYVPWLLLSTCLPARSLPVFVARFGTRVQVAAVFCILLAAIAEFAGDRNVAPDRGAGRAEQDRAIAWMLERVPRDGYVVCSYNYHPVFRRDTFFKSDVDLMDDGRDALEKYMPQFFPGPNSEHFSVAGYEKELAGRPPTVIAIHSRFTEAQGQALGAWLNSHGGLYEEHTVPGTFISMLQLKPGVTIPRSN